MPVRNELRVAYYRKILEFTNRGRRFITFNPAFILASAAAMILGMTQQPCLENITGTDMEKPFEIKAAITSLPQKSAYGYQFTLKPLSLSQNGNALKFNKEIILRIPATDNQEGGSSAENLFMGDTLHFRGTLQRPSYNLLPGCRDRRIIAASEGNPFSVRLKSSRQIRESEPPSSPEAFLFNYLEKYILFTEVHQEEEMCSLLRALVLGQKTALPHQVLEKLNRLGITHLFVISGFHIGLLAGMLFLLFLRKRSAASLLIISAVIWIYVWILGFSIPASRAGVVISIFTVVLYLGIQKNPLNSLGLAAIVILAISPRSVFLAGFQLTFICLLAIIWLGFPLAHFLDSPVRGCRSFIEKRIVTGKSRDSRLTRLNRAWFEEYFCFQPENVKKMLPSCVRLVSWPIKAMACTGSIQFFLFPLLIYYFNTFNFFSVAATALFMPFISVLVLNGILLLLFWWSPFNGILGSVYRFTGQLTLQLLEGCDSLFTPAYFPQPGIALLLVYYLFLLGMLAVNPTRGWIFPLVILLAFFSWSPVSTPVPEDSALRISMLDVGQGDCFHLRFPDGSSGLIDAGGTIFQDNEIFIGKNLISRYLWDCGVKELEYLLITHPEKDHFAGYEFLDKAFRISNFYFHDTHSGYPASGRRLSAGDTFVAGGVFHQVLWPERNSLKQYGPNDRSLVLLLTYGRFRMLFTGDISDEIEKILIRKYDLAGIPVLKASHHGSDSSSCREFLKVLRAEAVVISAGRRNAFGHPSPRVINRIKAAGMDIYSTPEHGTVTITTDGLSWSIEKQADSE